MWCLASRMFSNDFYDCYSKYFFVYVSGKFYLVDFDDGPAVVSGAWMSKDLKFCMWPPHASSMRPAQYYKFVENFSGNVDVTWKQLSVKVRHFSGGDVCLVHTQLQLCPCLI